MIDDKLYLNHAKIMRDSVLKGFQLHSVRYINCFIDGHDFGENNSQYQESFSLLI